MTLTQLANQVSQAIATGRIGRPVALRLHAFVASGPQDLLDTTASFVEVANQWFDSDLTRVETRGNPDDGHLTVLAEYSAGETALVGTYLKRQSPAFVDILLIGNQGTIEHDGYANAGQAPISLDEDQLANDSLRTALQQSLEKGIPMDVAAGKGG